MLRKVKQYSLKKTTEKNLVARDISGRNTSLKTLGFLIDETFFDDFEMFYEFGNELGLQGKDIKVFTFVKTKKKIPSVRHNQITNKEFNWRGEITNQNAQDFLEFPFDVLIGFYKGRQEYMAAMVSRSRAKFKIGFNGADARLFDLLLASDMQKPAFFKNEVKKYLKAFNKI
ncbi:hypothetical protein [Aequorivita sp. Q41]|uniref:DUF6913 domain-containing protein n=1 Tax=Aequorivita sp. Q41 TaxID=3153300 RepID=UPI003242C7E6